MRNKCNSNSGGFSFIGINHSSSSSECTDSLTDTTNGENTAVKRFTYKSYGMLPQVFMTLNMGLI